MEGGITIAERSIFRQSAITHYIQKQEEVVVPRLVSRPVLVTLWIVLGLLLIAMVWLLLTLFPLMGS